MTPELTFIAYFMMMSAIAYYLGYQDAKERYKRHLRRDPITGRFVQ